MSEKFEEDNEIQSKALQYEMKNQPNIQWSNPIEEVWNDSNPIQFPFPTPSPTEGDQKNEYERVHRFFIVE